MAKNVIMKQYNGSAYEEVYPRTLGSQVTTSSVSGQSTVDGALTSVNSSVSTINTKIGTTALPTTAQTLTGAIAETFTNVSNGKTLVASAITNKGVPTASDATFQTMATNIGNISFNFSGATVTAATLMEGIKAWDVNGQLITGTMPPSGDVVYSLVGTVYASSTKDQYNWQRIYTFSSKIPTSVKIRSWSYGTIGAFGTFNGGVGSKSAYNAAKTPGEIVQKNVITQGAYLYWSDGYTSYGTVNADFKWDDYGISIGSKWYRYGVGISDARGTFYGPTLIATYD